MPVSSLIASVTITSANPYHPTSRPRRTTPPGALGKSGPVGPWVRARRVFAKTLTGSSARYRDSYPRTPSMPVVRARVAAGQRVEVMVTEAIKNCSPASATHFWAG